MEEKFKLENQQNSANIDTSEFEFVQKDQTLSDTKFETKQISYLHDAFRRFAKNKGSVIAGIIIMFLLCFSVITPFFSGYDAMEVHDYYDMALPKCEAFSGTGFWDGTATEKVGLNKYVEFKERGSLVESSKSNDTSKGKLLDTYFDVRYDSYVAGAKNKKFAKSALDPIIEHDKTCAEEDKILMPMIDYKTYCKKTFSNTITRNNVLAYYLVHAYVTYEIDAKNQPIYVLDENGDATMDENGYVNLKRLYTTDDQGNYIYYTEQDDGGGFYSYLTRINWDNYIKFTEGKVPSFVLGSDGTGRDIMTRLAQGGRLSLFLGICVSLINFIVGVIYGAIEGYYGGKIDIVMERIVEILIEIPSTVIFVLFNWYLKDKVSVVVLLFIAFVATGWIGTSGTVRMQFYRFKNQEYVLAARTLGARDPRLIFKHILPNSLGTLVTSSVLMIPGVIFSESSLTYLKIVDLGSTVSIGLMLSEGQVSFATYPNLILWPALFISLLMICFNIFGNGLRDAFNPTLRGAD